MYPKDTEKWKQFTTTTEVWDAFDGLFCIPKILKNESNSQPNKSSFWYGNCCFVSQRYWKMKAIHNLRLCFRLRKLVVLYPKDTEKWKQFTTDNLYSRLYDRLFCIPKILKNESNSQRTIYHTSPYLCCFVSQRYWKMKAIHNKLEVCHLWTIVVLYPKDTEKWKQFTTKLYQIIFVFLLFCIPKILKNESNSQPFLSVAGSTICCFVSQRYWKMKAIHNYLYYRHSIHLVVLYPKDTEKWKQFTTS